MRFLLGAALGGVLHVILVTAVLTLVSVAIDGPRHLAESIAFTLIGAVLTVPIGAVLGGIAGVLSVKRAAGVVTAIGAGLGFAGGGLVSLWAIARNAGLIPIILGVGVITGALIMGATAKVFSMTRTSGGR